MRKSEEQMLTIYHLEKSRSMRIVWLCEELGLKYDLKLYARDPETNFAPEELKTVHLLGKAPIITDDDLTLVELAAIIEYILLKYGNGALKPATDSPKYPYYLQWLHFTESSMALPLELGMFVHGPAKDDPNYMRYYNAQHHDMFTYVNNHLAKNTFVLGDEFSAADIQITPLLIFGIAQGSLGEFRHINEYVARMQQRPAFDYASKV